jgi:hypothetical protein
MAGVLVTERTLIASTIPPTVLARADETIQ